MSLAIVQTQDEPDTTQECDVIVMPCWLSCAKPAFDESSLPRGGAWRVGVHWATEQCRDLLDHEVRGIHFYTLNRSTATRDIWANLGISGKGN